jgi:hypothetical protein
MNEDTSMAPDEAALRTDVQSAACRAGEFEGRWGLEDPPGITWPYAVFWVAAPDRPNSPSRFRLRLELSGYSAQPPTGRFWDVKTGGPLALADYPKGRGDTAKVFRTDWPNQDAAKGETPGCALYHPFDRRAASDHPQWKGDHPHQQWHSQRSVIDYLEMVYGLLNSPTYTGIR